MRPLCLASLLLLAASSAGAADADPLLPPDTQLAAGVQVRALLDSALGKKYLKEYLAAQGKGLGIDPLPDIDHLTLTGPSGLEKEKMLLIVRGRFDPMKIEAVLDKQAERSDKQGERRLFQVRLPERGPVFFCVLDRECLVMAASKEPILDAIARKDGKKPGGVSPELKTLLGKIDDQATFWLAGLATPELKKMLTPNAEYRRIVDSLQSFRGSVMVDDGLRADVLIQTNDARAAVEIRKFVEGVKALLILAAVNQDKKNGAVWADLLATLKIATQGDAVTVKGQATGEQIEKNVQNRRKGQP